MPLNFEEADCGISRMTVDPQDIVESYCRNWDGAAPYARATIIRTEGANAAKAGAKAIITAEGELIGWLGGGCLKGAVLRAAKDAIRVASPRLIRVRPSEQVTGSVDADGVELHASHCPSKGGADIFIEPVLPKPPLVVLGASHVAMAIAEMAGNLNFCLLPVEALAENPAAARASIVVATQGAGDYAALKAAMATSAPYVAFVASRNKAEAMRLRLHGDGFGETSLARLHAPAGLDIGSETPAEIAVSIMAEIIKLRHASRKAGQP